MLLALTLQWQALLVLYLLKVVRNGRVLLYQQPAAGLLAKVCAFNAPADVCCTRQVFPRFICEHDSNLGLSQSIAGLKIFTALCSHCPNWAGPRLIERKVATVSYKLLKMVHAPRVSMSNINRRILFEDH